MPTKLPFLSVDHHLAIANVAVRSAQLENHVERLANTAMTEYRLQQETAKFVLKNIGADRVVGLMVAALTDAAPDQRQNIEKLDAEIVRLRRERNEVLHWIWGKSLDDTVAVHVSYRPHRAQMQKSKTAPEIQEIADGMLNVVRKLIDWDQFFHDRWRQRSRDTLLGQAQPEHFRGLLSEYFSDPQKES